MSKMDPGLKVTSDFRTVAEMRELILQTPGRHFNPVLGDPSQTPPLKHSKTFDTTTGYDQLSVEPRINVPPPGTSWLQIDEVAAFINPANLRHGDTLEIHMKGLACRIPVPSLVEQGWPVTIHRDCIKFHDRSGVLKWTWNTDFGDDVLHEADRLSQPRSLIDTDPIDPRSFFTPAPAPPPPPLEDDFTDQDTDGVDWSTE